MPCSSNAYHIIISPARAKKLPEGDGGVGERGNIYVPGLRPMPNVTVILHLKRLKL